MKKYRFQILAFAFLGIFAAGMQINGQLVKAYLERLASDPSGAGESRIYWNTAEKKAKIFNGTTWGGLGGGVVVCPG